MRKQKFFLLVALLIFSQNFLFAIADWTILNYIQSDNNLYSYVLQDLAEMSTVGSGPRLNILAQIDIPNDKGTWRYKVDKGGLTLDTFLQAEMGQHVVDEMVGAMQWAASKYPAKHYMLVLSSHGYGVIDPHWGKHRGILFDDSDQSYMDNQELASALSQIKSNVLQNKKLDVLGMDACLMGMVEIAYQVKDYANLFVASQASEAAAGWYYSNFLSPVAASYCTPSQLAQNIVSAFQTYYQSRASDYTQSAVDLNNISLVKQNVDEVIFSLTIGCANRKK